jgi:hypothetical protein
MSPLAVQLPTSSVSRRFCGNATRCVLTRSALDLETENFKWWPRLHGFWRTLPNFNPYTVSSDPGQDLANEAHSVLMGGRTLIGSESVRGVHIASQIELTLLQLRTKTICHLCFRTHFLRVLTTPMTTSWAYWAPLQPDPTTPLHLRRFNHQHPSALTTWSKPRQPPPAEYHPV